LSQMKTTTTTKKAAPASKSATSEAISYIAREENGRIFTHGTLAPDLSGMVRQMAARDGVTIKEFLQYAFKDGAQLLSGQKATA